GPKPERSTGTTWSTGRAAARTANPTSCSSTGNATSSTTPGPIPRDPRRSVMRAHSGLLEPDARRPARPVLRGPLTREGQRATRLPGSVGDMLAEARGYHFGMVLAHQNLSQMPRDTQLAISANARSKIFFSCAPEDAHQLARHTMPELDEHDLSHMDAF